MAAELDQARDAVFFERLRAQLEPERWVLDGNYPRTIPIKWSRTTLAIWLDYPLALATYRVFKRSVRCAISQDELWPGTNNRESIGRLLSRQSMVLWTLQTHARVRRDYDALIQERASGTPPFVRLSSPRAAAKFLKEVARLRRSSGQARVQERAPS